LLNGFTTKEDMDEADQVAINEALFELMSMEEEQKLRDSQDPSYPTEGLVWTAENGLQAAPTSAASSSTAQMPTPRASNSLPATKQPDRSGRAHRPVSRPVSQADQQPGKTPKSTAAFKGLQSKGPTAASWQCKTCTLINEANARRCDACDAEGPSRPRVTQSKAPAAPPQPKENRVSLGWNCRQCGTFMESRWWTCSLCGLMKANS
jgi:hypothetical protein